MPIDINISVTLKADASLTDLMAYSCAWAADLYTVLHPGATPPYTAEAVETSLGGGGVQEEHAEKSPVTAPAAVPTKDASVSTTKAKTDAPAANPAPPAKAAKDAPAKSVENPDAKVSGDMLLAMRAAVMGFGTSDKTGENRKKLRAWLDEHGLAKVTDATNAQAMEIVKFIQSQGKEAKKDA